MSPIPVNRPRIGEREKALVNQCLDEGWISSEGPWVARFEEAFATQSERTHGIAVSNGTAALEIAVRALGLGAGDEVILPTFCIISCAQAVTKAGATPVLVDSRPDTWNMDPAHVAARITPRTRAILVVHTYGLPCDLDPILALAQRHGLAVIEDAAEMIGQTYRGRPCGSFGTLSTFSFYANKHVSTGEGGMILTNDPQLAERCRSLRNLCFQPQRRFVHEEIGWNYRLTSLQAALGLAQLEQLPDIIRHKQALGATYHRHLSTHPCLQLPPPTTGYAHNIYWVFGLILRPECQQTIEQLTARLAQQGVGTRPFFWPIHEQPVYLRQGLFAGESHPVASMIARRGFYLPSGSGNTLEEATQSATTLVQLLHELS